MSYRADETELSLIFPLKFEMRGVALFFPGSARSTYFDSIEVRPSLLKALLFKPGGSIEIKQDQASVNADISMGASKVQIDYEIRNFDLNRMEGLDGLIYVMLGGKINGKGSLDINSESFSETTGSFAIEIRDFFFPSQKLDRLPPGADPIILDFAFPEASVSSIRLNVGFEAGKIQIKEAILGQRGSATDDIIGTLTGGADLAKSFGTSRLRIQTVMSLSPRLKALDILLSSYRTKENSFEFKIGGTFSSPKLDVKQ
jgi:type II secretion system protein N